MKSCEAFTESSSSFWVRTEGNPPLHFKILLQGCVFKIPPEAEMWKKKRRRKKKEIKY